MFVMQDADDFAQSVSYWRNQNAWGAIYLIRMIVVGTFCDDPDEPLDSSNFDADYWEVNDLYTGSRVISAPSYDRCDGRITYKIEEIDISVRNGNEYDATGGEFVAVDDWVSYAINS